jgi:hypothetical protein
MVRVSSVTDATMKPWTLVEYLTALFIIGLIVACIVGCATTACPETAERERVEHGKYVVWCAP